MSSDSPDRNPDWYYTYVLQCDNGEFYTGMTGNLRRRVKQHQNGNVQSTQHIRPVQLIYYEACHSQDDAQRREDYLKSGHGKRYIRDRLEGFLSG